MSTAIDFTKKTLAIVTGASQGIGRTIAVEIGQKMINNSKLILIARSEGGLDETKQLIANENSNVTVEVYPLDLSKPDVKEYELIFDKAVNTEYDVAVIFHNAGQVGTLKPTTDLTDLDYWRSYFDLNMFSVVLLNNIFVKHTKECKQRFVINISSLVGHKPFANMAMYGSGKAARDIFFAVLAVEEPNIVVFRYCPGPVDTPMLHEVMQNIPIFSEPRDANAVLTTKQTVGKLLSILENGKYKSGDLVDYFDV